jgi:hypothetical protein
MKFTETTVEKGFYGYFRYPYRFNGKPDYRTVIFKADPSVHDAKAITIVDGEKHRAYHVSFGASHNDKDFDQRPATASEIAWLDACIKAREIVPNPSDAYEIY